MAAPLAQAFASKLSSVANVGALFPSSVEQITTLSATAMDKAKAALGKIMSADTPLSFESVARATDHAQAEFDVACSILSVNRNTHPDKALRDASNAELSKLQAFSIDHFETNRDLYKRFEALRATAKDVAAITERAAAGDEYSKVLDYWLNEALDEWKRQGMHLPQAEFEQAVALQKEIADLSLAFGRNVAEFQATLSLTKDELKGTPDSVVAALKPDPADATKLLVGLDYPTYFGVMKNCEVAATRAAMAKLFDDRAYPVNMDVLHKLIAKRHALSTVLGYKSFAHLNLANKMAKSPETAAKFVADLVPRLQQKWDKEFEMLKAAGLHPSIVLDAKGQIPASDVTFATNQYMKEHMRVDETKIQEYFPLEATVAALFSIYESFFGIKFTKHTKLGGAYWHESVEVLEVHKDGALLGYVVLDLFPREGKYSHACCHGVVPAVALTSEAGSTYSPALAVVIANFPTATSDRPALFLHSDVETFFHEFGHAIHGLFGRTPMATVAGTNVKRDFVELPSQMLENWVWQPAILKQISQHFQSKQPLPEELIAAKVASKSTFNGRDYLRQLQFARYSLEIFGAEFAAQAEEKLDTTALMDRIRHEVLPHIAHPQNSHFQCAFGHLTGYGAGYYGYMWSEVFSADVFATINKVPGGLLSPEMGERYTRHIIGPGGSRDPAEMIEAFLGRAPNSDAFMEDLGIKN